MRWLREDEMREPAYPSRTVPNMLDPYKEQLVIWLRADSRRPKRDRRTAKVLFQLLQAQDYPGGYARVAIFARQWREAGREFMSSAQNAVLIGGPGTGKAHPATAIGVEAIQRHQRLVRFFSTVELVNALEQEKAAGK
jgi:DNA replication protein DnaC